MNFIFCLKPKIPHVLGPNPKGPKHLHGAKSGFCARIFPYGLGKYSLHRCLGPFGQGLMSSSGNYDPKPETLIPKPETPSPKPETPNPKPQTRNPKPVTLNHTPSIDSANPVGRNNRDDDDDMDSEPLQRLEGKM